MHNRVQKIVKNNSSSTVTKVEMYIRDATGNIIATYDKAAGSMDITERYIYAKDRIGISSGVRCFHLTEYEIKDLLRRTRHRSPQPRVTSYNNYYAWQLCGKITATTAWPQGMASTVKRMIMILLDWESCKITRHVCIILVSVDLSVRTP